MEPPPDRRIKPDEQEALLGEVTKLIELLDRYLFLRGQTLTSHIPSSYPQSTSIFSNTFATNVPASQSHFPEVALSEHLDDLESEKQEVKDLTAKISSICLSNDVVALAKSQISIEYSALKSSDVIKDFESKGVVEMLAILRAEQKSKTKPVNETVQINVVTTIKSDGNASNIERINIPNGASWVLMQERLTRTTSTWQAKEAGCPGGYSLKHGKWLYQTCKASVIEPQPHDLSTARQYHEMRSKMDDMGVTVLIWHEKVLNESQSRTAKAKEDERIWEETQPRNPDGTPMFGKLEPQELPELMKDEMQVLPAPGVEPLSDDAHDKNR